MIEPLFDFEKGEFVFNRGGEVQLVTGIEELKNQIRKVPNTPLGKHKIYEGSGWGTRLSELLVGRSLPREYVKSEVERCIREAVSELYGVERVDSFDVSQKGSVLSIYFRVHSIFGSFDQEEELIYG